jgi:hypothetical protein
MSFDVVIYQTLLPIPLGFPPTTEYSHGYQLKYGIDKD